MDLKIVAIYIYIYIYIYKKHIKDHNFDFDNLVKAKMLETF